MAQNQTPYRRLPGTGYQYAIPPWAIFVLFFVIGIFALLFRGRRLQLWQGEEHLLLVEWDGYREHYKRFDYRDIQAVVVRETKAGRLLSLVLTVFASLFTAFAISASETITRIIFLVLAGVIGLILFGNVLAGPTCSCFIRTAVQTEPLPSLGRLKRARRVLARIRPLIVAAQGPLTPEDISMRLRAGTEAETGTEGEWDAVPRYGAADPNAPPTMTA